MSNKPADILNKLKSKKTSAETYMESMRESQQEHKHIQDTEQFTDHNNEHVPVQETKHVTKSETILEKYAGNKTKEDLFTRQTYLIRNDLIKRFDKAAQSRRKGFKTDVINELLENFLNENGL